MEARTELSREVDAEHEEEQVIEFGKASQETRGTQGVQPEGSGKFWFE